MSSTPPRVVGRYTIYEPIAAGGMAAVHFGRLHGAAGFARTVAVKRLRSELAPEPEFVAMLTDEARLTSRIQHPNVVPTLDVVADGAELFIVLEYVHGESLARLARAQSENRTGAGLVPVPIAVAIVVDLLRGLHAAHEAHGADGDPLELVHRDVSPQNVIVDVHGRARVLDFGVAKARQRQTLSTPEQLKGKLRYMAPEQVHGHATRQSDVFASGIVLWELLVGAALFPGPGEAATLAQVLGARIPKPSERGVELSPALEAVVMRALDRRLEARFTTAQDMASALSEAATPASTEEVAAWVRRLAASALDRREARLRELDREDSGADAAPRPVSSAPAAAVTRVAPAPRKRALAVSVSVLALLAVGGAAAWVAKGRRVVPDVPVAASAEAPASAVAASASSVASVVPSASIAPPDVPASAAPPASVASPAPAAVPARKRAAPPSRSGAPAVRSACDPPYEFDAHGVKVYKRECFASKH